MKADESSCIFFINLAKYSVAASLICLNFSILQTFRILSHKAVECKICKIKYEILWTQNGKDIRFYWNSLLRPWKNCAHFQSIFFPKESKSLKITEFVCKSVQMYIKSSKISTFNLEKYFIKKYYLSLKKHFRKSRSP